MRTIRGQKCQARVDTCKRIVYSFVMIRSFRHKGLARLWRGNDQSGVRADLVERLRRRLRALSAATSPSELNVPGFDFHPLRGKPKRYSIHVNGPFCLTFEWIEVDAWRVDLEQYH